MTMDVRFKTLALVVVASLVGLAAALPLAGREPRALDLTAVLNQTVCPVEVTIDEDAARIPQRIKMLRCARDVNQWCALKNVPKNECCQHQHAGLSLACVEVEDTVMVYFPKEDQSQPLRVSVGCVCVMQEAGVVEDAVPAR